MNEITLLLMIKFFLSEPSNKTIAKFFLLISLSSFSLTLSLFDLLLSFLSLFFDQGVKMGESQNKVVVH